MSPRVASWFRFLLLYAAIALVLGGALLFFGFSTHVYHYDYQHTSDTMPDTGLTTDYQDLTPAQQRMVDSAIAGERTRFAFDSKAPIPAEHIRKGDTYYVFSYYTTFDWLDYHTFGPALVALAGFLVAYGAIKWEQRYNPFA